ncbi:hypothetical protein FRC07_000155 [Ceratobasidium sp. 392]|nr:hypothetical protein FRC07_000155 [Ceratobasidium sp. 392]
MDVAWGPLLNEYFDIKPNTSNQRSLIPRAADSSTAMVSAIHKFKTSNNISVKTLEELLAIEQIPKLQYHLHGPGMIPACLTLVRQCRQTPEILNHAYGYLALRILCLVLESSLHANNRLIVVRKETDVCDLMTKNVTTYVVLSCESKEPFLLWKPSSHFDKPEIFPFAGGLTISDTRFLLETVFDERKAIFNICLKSGLPGFSKVLVILWQYALSQRNEILSTQLDILQHRNYIVSPECDRLLTRTFSKAFVSRTLSARGSSTCADHEDAENLINAFQRNLNLNYHEDSATLLMWITEAVTLGGDKNRYASRLIGINRDLTTIMVQKHNYGPDEEIGIMELGETMTRSIG